MKKPLLFLLCLGVIGAAVTAENWPSFRGPRAIGFTDAAETAVQWDITSVKNIRWKADLAGAAHASPVVWGDRVYISTAIGSPKDWHDDSVRHSWVLYSFDKRTGKLIWKQTAAEGKPRAGRHEKASQCNSTPVTDGQYVAAIMGPEGLFCYDMNGKLLWKKDLGLLNPGLAGDVTSQWGHASSPVIYKHLVIVQVDRHQDSFLAAYHLNDGKEVWRVARDELPTWSTPTIYESKNRVELITNGGKYIRSYNPLSGKELWRFADPAEVKQPTPVVVGEFIYVTGGYPRGRPIYALRTGASGDISLKEGEETNRALAWKVERGGPYTVTPLIYQNHLYNVANSGVLTCYNARNGEKVYEQRLEGEYSASPIANRGKIYFAGEDGAVRVVQAGPEFKLLATNQMNEPCFATPAISDGTLFVRTLKTLYAIAGR